MNIVVIDDHKEELEKAVKAVKTAGHKAIPFSDCEYCNQKPSIWQKISKADGVITDLYFNPMCGNDAVRRDYSDDAPPMGLVIAIHALSAGKPVVICTNGNHHGHSLSFIYDAYITKADKIGIGWEEDKDWNRAVKLLTKGLDNFEDEV